MKKLLLIILSSCLLSGCSVGMALHGKKEPNLAALKIGQDRQEVVLNLGQPDKTIARDEKRIDEFKIQKGNAPSAGRAIGHGLMDVLTLGAWEIIGTPIEAFSGSSNTLIIEYNENDKVTKINQGVEESAL